MYTNSCASSPAEGSSSTLAFANAQLIAHGFVRSPGLQLDALSHREQDIAAKCLLAMLGQRMVSTLLLYEKNAQNAQRVVFKERCFAVG